MKLSSMVGVLLVLSALLSLTFNVGPVSAVWPNNNTTYFYQKGSPQTCGLAKCPVLPAQQKSGSGDNGYATFAFSGAYYTSGTASVTKARTLVNELKQYYSGSHSNVRSAWGYNSSYSKTGAAFVVKTMLGLTDGQSVNVSSAQWTQLENRLVAKAQAGQINWNVTKSRQNQSNTAMARVYPTGSSVRHYDVKAYNEISNAPRLGLRIANSNGTFYELLYACGNPSGQMSGLDDEDWELDPSVETNPSDGVEPESDLTVQASLATSGTSRPDSTQWQISRILIDPGVSIPSAANSSSNPCSYFGGAGRSCSVATFDSGGSGTGNTSFTVPVHTFSARHTTVPDLQPGQRLCYALSVQPRAHNSTQWRHSEPACVYVGKRPKVQVLGGDLLVGRALPAASASTSDVYTSITTKNISNQQRTFGSWVEYGAFATGRINGLGSGSAFAGPNGLLTGSGSTKCQYNPLTFANAANNQSCTNSTILGRYSTNAPIPDISSMFSSSGGSSDLGSRASLILSAGYLSESGVYTTDRDNVSISGGTGEIQPGRWLVLYAPNTTVTITGDINYTNGVLNSTDDIPQVLIIAENINIRSSVGNVDAWLVATGSGSNGYINTCSDFSLSAALTIDRCDEQLTVNGPVAANHLHLRRTAGSNTGSQSGAPAEVFNLRPDAYIWAMNRARASGQPSTVFTLESPPRF